MEIYNEKPLPPVKAKQGRAPRLTGCTGIYFETTYERDIA